MSDYISREKLKAAYLEAHKGSPGGAFTLICEALAEDVAPAVHGHWNRLHIVWECSNCGETISMRRYMEEKMNFCSNCGARMDEVSE